MPGAVGPPPEAEAPRPPCQTDLLNSLPGVKGFSSWPIVPLADPKSSQSLVDVIHEGTEVLLGRHGRVLMRPVRDVGRETVSRDGEGFYFVDE